MGRLYKLFFLLSFFSLYFGSISFVTAAGKPDVVSKTPETLDSVPYVPAQVIVKFKKDQIDLSATLSVSSQIRRLIFSWTTSYQTDETQKNGNILILNLKKGQPVDEVINTLMSDPSVEFAEPNYYRQVSSLGTDDTYKNNLWGLNNYGQSITLNSGSTITGTSGADIDMVNAWALTTGTTEVVVAVIDTGVAYNHPDLINNMWDGTNCVDENGSALGNCLHGYDYASGDKDPLPVDSAHGTHVAGTIAAARNNTKGIAGIGPKIKIMAIRCDLTVSCLAKSIDFAIQNGAKIINASYSGTSYSATESDAINRFRTAGGIFIGAAGNSASDNDTTTHNYPSDYNLDNIISVTATDQNDVLASYSNIGATSVDIAAPGSNIYSTINETPVISYDFNTLLAGQIPAVWTSDLGVSWGATDIGPSGTVDMAVWSDLVTPYVEGVNSVVTSNTIDLSSVGNAKFDLFTYCDTEITDPTFGGDYMALEVSGNGSTFTELTRWNRFTIFQATGGSSTEFTDLVLAPQYLTNTFKYRLRWVTDSDGSRGGGQGCLVDDFKILTYTDGANELYGFKSGTSMAVPHVAGLAGYLWSIKPSATAAQIITNILSSGDSLPSLVGKITTGKRINAYTSLLNLGVSFSGPDVTGLSNDAVPKKSKTITWTSAAPGTDQYRFLIDQSIGSTPSGTYSTLATTTYSTGSGTFYIHVQAKNTDNQEGPVSTASFILDNTGPSATIDQTYQRGFRLSFGETIYNNVGATFSSIQDLSGRFSYTSEIGASLAFAYTNQSITIGVTGTPVAGSKVTLLSGAANNFFDYLTNAGGTLAVIYDGDSWTINPTNLNVAATNVPYLITTGQITLTGGSSPDTATSLTVDNNITVSIGASGTNSSVGLTLGTIISEIGDSIFNATLISGTQVDISGVSNIGDSSTPITGIQWGLIGTTLKFSQPIVVRIYLGPSYDGQTINIYRSPSLSSGWTTTGLSASTCVVSSGYCIFTATQASYYLASLPAIVPTPTPAPTSALTSSGDPPYTPIVHDAPQCHDRTPLNAPDLFKIITSNGSAKIIFTPVNTEPVTGYAVFYGLKKGDNRYASMIYPVNNNQGEQNFTINKLNPKATYFFRVTAFNGCTSGPWSDWISAKANGKKEVHKYKTVIKNNIRTLLNLF